MRIIITKEGNEIINDLSKSLNHNKNSYNPLIQNKFILNENNYSSSNIKFPELLRSSSTPSINYNNNSKLTSSQNQKKTDDSSNLSQINLNENRNKLKVKLLKLHLNKLKIPENQTNLYLQDKLNESSIINQKTNIHSTLNKNNLKIKNKYSLAEIINENCFNNLNKKILAEIERKKNNIFYSNQNLRNYKNYYNIFNDINEQKKREIDVNYSNLIFYLKNKKNITKNFLNKLSKYNEKKLTKLDKISLKFLNKENKEVERKIFVENYLKSVNQKELSECKNNLNIMKSKLFFSRNKILDYKDKFQPVKSKKLIYIPLFLEFEKKYWQNKNNYSRFYHKNNLNKSKSVNDLMSDINDYKNNLLKNYEIYNYILGKNDEKI